MTATYDFSAFSENTMNGGQGGGMSFAMGGTSSGSPAATGAASSPMGAAASGMPAAGSSSDVAALIGQSPFGALLNLPGVTPESLFSNVNPANYGGIGGNPFAALGDSIYSGAYGGNPFAAIGPFVNQAVASGSSTGGVALNQQ